MWRLRALSDAFPLFGSQLLSTLMTTYFPTLRASGGWALIFLNFSRRNPHDEEGIARGLVPDTLNERLDLLIKRSNRGQPAD